MFREGERVKESKGSQVRSFRIPPSSTYYSDHRRVPSLPWRSGLRESNGLGVKYGCTLFIDDLPLSMNNLWLYQIFKNYGNVSDTFVPQKIRKNNQLKFGFVTFTKKDDALRAITRNDGLVIKAYPVVGKISKKIIS